MANFSSPKNSYALTTLLFILLFLSSIFLFTKRALEPSISLYRNLSSPTDSHVSSPESTLIDSQADTEPIDSSTHQSILPISQTQRVEPDTSADNFDGKLSVEDDKKNPVAGNESVGTLDDNVDSSTQQSIGRISQTQSIVYDTSADNSHGELSPEEDKKNPVADKESVGTFGDNVDSSTNLSMSRISQTQRTESDTIADNFDGDVKEDKKSPVSDNESVGTLGDNGVNTLIENMKNCDFYAGTWVKDEEYPLYKSDSCPYVDEAFDCQRNGRRDSEYLKWRWKPDGCSLPRFNATDFLERLRGKRLMLVGDSMNRNQFESMICLLREGLPDKSRMYEIHGHKITKGRGYFVFKFADYDCTVAFVRSHFLVKEGVRINAQGNTNPILSIDKIDKTYGRWKRADILVFNTGHWWVHGKTARGVNYYKEGDYLYPKFDAVEAYRRALRTWAKWIRENVEPEKQLVFYRGYSSAHFRGGDWDSGGSCNGETEPILSGAFLDSYPLKMKIVEEVIREMQVPVILLNVTRLTNFRKDGHPSFFGKNMTDGKKVSRRRQDCSHWCLPGVPDAWNELIYASLVFNQTISRS